MRPLSTGALAEAAKRRALFVRAAAAGCLLAVVYGSPLRSQPTGSGGWAQYSDRLGFTLMKPDDWRVHAENPGDISVSDPRGKSAAMVRARIVPQQANLAQWLQQQYPATEPGLVNVRMLKVEAMGPQVVRAAFDYGGNAFQGRASVIAVRGGDVATVFVAAATRAEFAQRLPELTRILESVRFGTGGPGGPPPRREALQFTRWVEPNESAFSAELPAGWRNEGGLRRTTWNVRLAFTSTSPDGSAMIYSGDATVPRMFIEPNATTRSLGNPEGQYTGPDGQMLLPFQRAEEFGANLARNRFNAQILGTRPRPDLVQIAQRNPLLQGNVSAASAADIDFRLPDGRIGVLTVTTFGAAVGGVGGSWWADGIHGFIAPPDRASLAAGAMARMIVTARENPQWAAGEREHQVRMGEQYQAYLNWSTNLQRQSIEQRWLADEARQQGIREGLGNTLRLRDPVTGETFEASATDRYYFRIKGADRPTAIGSDVDFKPPSDVELTRLLRIGVEVPDR